MNIFNSINISGLMNESIITQKILGESIDYNGIETLKNEEALKIFFERSKKLDFKYSPDKKQMQKEIMKDYIKVIRAYADEIFDTIGNTFRYEHLQRIILFVKYNKSANPSQLIKEIKKMDISLTELITIEYILLRFKLRFLLDGKVGSEPCKKQSYLNNLPLMANSILACHFNMLGETVMMLKAILFDYYNSSSASFNDELKPKKTFINKKLFCSESDAFYLVTNNIVTLDEFAKFADTWVIDRNTKFITNQELMDATRYFLDNIRLNYNVVDDDYSKMILGSKYTSLIQNRIDNPSEVMITPIPSDVFFRRKVLIPNSGVLLLIKDNEAIDSILIKEVVKFDVNHIVAIVKYKDGKEIVNAFELSVYDKTYYPCWMYKEEKLTNSHTVTDYLMDFFNSEEYSEYLPKLNYEAIAPTYWKYRNRGYKSENDTLNDKGVVVKREFKIEIAPFIRKIKGQPSNDAIKLSKQLGVILEDGYTIVKPHIRTYNSNKSS